MIVEMQKSSCLAAALGVKEFITAIATILAHFVVLLRSDLDIQQAHL